MKAVDSHAHLDDRAFDKDRASLIAELFREEIGVVTIGTSLASSEAAIALARQAQASLGNRRRAPPQRQIPERSSRGAPAGACHASEGRRNWPRSASTYYRDLSPRDRQREVFRAQLDLARSLGLPICPAQSGIDRGPSEDPSGRRERPTTGVVHSFLGDAEILGRAFLDTRPSSRRVWRSAHVFEERGAPFRDSPERRWTGFWSKPTVPT